MICVQIEDRRRLMLKLSSRWNLPPKGANYASPGLEGSGLQSSELSLYDMIHLSLIGRVLEVWILLEWRLLPWFVAEVAPGPGSRSSTAWYSLRASNNCIPKRHGESRRLQARERKEVVPWTLIKQASGHPIFEVHLGLWKRMDPYRNIDSENSNRKFFHRGNDKPSEGYILGTGIATSAMLPLLVL